jgi:sRNA-binding carbon storage regulator CsrA
MIFDSHGSIVTTTIHKIMVHGQKIKVRIQAPDTIEFFRTDCRIRRIAG